MAGDDLFPVVPARSPTCPVLFPRAHFDIVVVGASAGGIVALKSIVERLPASFATPIVVAQHLPQLANSQLPRVLGWRARLLTQFAHDKERLRAGTLYVAPPGTHVTVAGNGRLQLDREPRVQFVRPSANRLFESAASTFGSRVLALVLSGMGSDGARGARAVKNAGGVVVVQDPMCAEAPSMPLGAIEACDVNLVLPLRSIPSALSSLCEVIGVRELFCGRLSAS
jgi:two-component system chemotaxis response regulator CheB